MIQNYYGHGTFSWTTAVHKLFEYIQVCDSLWVQNSGVFRILPWAWIFLQFFQISFSFLVIKFLAIFLVIFFNRVY